MITANIILLRLTAIFIALKFQSSMKKILFYRPEQVILSQKHQSIDIDTQDDYEMAQEIFSVLVKEN